MNFREALTTEHSKKLALEIANTVTDNPPFLEDSAIDKVIGEHGLDLIKLVLDSLLINSRLLNS